MTIGLTSDELYSAFEKYLEKEVNDFEGHKEAVEHGESPNEIKIVSAMITDKSILTPAYILCNIRALLSTIARNNEVLAQTILKSKP